MSTPRYLAIKEWINEEIEAAQKNTPIRSEREMAQRFSVSRMTVRNAVNELVEEGVLYRNGNKGTFISDRKLSKKNTASLRLKEDIEDFTILYFNVKECSDIIAEKLAIKPLDWVLHVIRLNKRDGHPQSVEEIFLIRNNFSDQDLNNIPKLLDLDRYTKKGIVSQKLIPVLVPVQYANLLQLKMDTPIIKVESTINSITGRPIALIEAYNNPDETPIEIIQ